MITDKQSVGIIEMTYSLMSSVAKAGGAVTPALFQMSVQDLICALGPNNIRFVYKDKDEQVQEKKL